MAKTSIKSCDCKSTYQDSAYGNGQRVHNIGGGAKTVATHKCTVCGRKK